MRPLRADIFTTEHAPKRWPLYGPHYYDELAAEIENGPIVCHIWANHWYRIVDHGLRIGVLEAAEDGGLIAKFLASHGLTGGVFEPRDRTPMSKADGTNGSSHSGDDDK